MSNSAFHWKRRRVQRDVRAEAPTPDVAHAVMARLGFQATDRRAARHVQVVGIMRRCAGTLLVVAIFGSGLWWVDSSRRASLQGAAFEDLLRSSMRENRDRLSNVFDTLAPLALPSPNGAPALTEPTHPLDGVILDDVRDNARDGVRKIAIAPFRKA